MQLCPESSRARRASLRRGTNGHERAAQLEAFPRPFYRLKQVRGRFWQHLEILVLLAFIFS